jgi:hypothetical protein
MSNVSGFTRSKFVKGSLLALAFAALYGCGGSGSGSEVINAGAPRIEAVLRGNAGVVQDPSNFQINEQFVFQLVRYNAGGTREVLPNVNWATSDERRLFGTLGENSGAFAAGSQETPPDLNAAIQASWEGRTFTSPWAIRPRQVRLIGRVTDESAPGTGVDGVRIVFLAPRPPNAADPDAPAGLVEVGSVLSGADGTFRASVPGTTTNFTIDEATLPTRFYRSFLANIAYPAAIGDVVTPDYNRFDVGGTCLAPVPGGLPAVGFVDMSKQMADGDEGPVSVSTSIQLTPKSSGPLKPDPDPCYY